LVRVLLKTAEYIWYPVLLTMAFYAFVKLDLLDRYGWQVTMGAFVFGIILWKLADFILRQPLGRQIVLVAAWAYIFIRFAILASNPQPGVDYQREGAYAVLPLALVVKYMQINRSEN
jgi:hypothetical protein